MRSIFTVHAGEFIVGEHLERTYEGLNIWVPAKDTGVDLLVTNSTNSKGVSFQTKFSRDFLTTDIGPEFQTPTRVCGWFTLTPTKLERSSAQFCLFVLIGSKARSRDYVLLEPQRAIEAIKGRSSTRLRARKIPSLSVGHGKGTVLGNQRSRQRWPIEDSGR